MNRRDAKALGRVPAGWHPAADPRATAHRLVDLHQRRLQREATGSAVLGVSMGLAQLDGLLGGLNEGLHLLAGPLA